MSDSKPIHEYPNRAGNTNIPMLDYSKWVNRLCGYAQSTYIMVMTSAICASIAIATGEDWDGRGWTTVRDSWEDWKKNIGDISAEKGLQRLVPITRYAAPNNPNASKCAKDTARGGVRVVVINNTDGAVNVIELADQYVNSR